MIFLINQLDKDNHVYDVSDHRKNCEKGNKLVEGEKSLNRGRNEWTKEL